MSIENIYVKVNWVAPINNGATITNYKLLILAGDQLSWLESEKCDSTDPILVTDLHCYIPMEELTGDRFNLSYNEFISIKVQAMNLRGWSELSDTNSISVYTEVVPLVVQQPMIGVLTTETEIDVYWSELTN
jgi:hypothetical protein